MEDKIIIIILTLMVVVLFIREIKRQRDIDDARTPVSRRHARKIIKMLKAQEDDLNLQREHIDARDEFMISLNDRVDTLAKVIEPIVKMLGVIADETKNKEQ